MERRASELSDDERRERVGADSLMGPAFFQNPLPMSITNSESQRFTAVNQAFLDLTGFWRSEAIGATSAQLNLWVKRSTRERIGQELDRSMAAGPEEGEMRTKAGEIVTCRYAFRLLSADGAPHVLTVIVPDPW